MLLAEHGLDQSGVCYLVPVGDLFTHFDPRSRWQAYHGTDPLQLARVSHLSFYQFYFPKTLGLGARMLTSSLVKVETYFTEVNAGSVPKYVPRSVQIDLEAGVCDRVRMLHCATPRDCRFAHGIHSDTFRSFRRAVQAGHVHRWGRWCGK
jgi:hypothetical protein